MRGLTWFLLGFVAGATVMAAWQLAAIARVIDSVMPTLSASPIQTAIPSLAPGAEPSLPTATRGVLEPTGTREAAQPTATTEVARPTATTEVVQPTATAGDIWPTPSPEEFRNEHEACVALRPDPLNPATGCNVVANPYFALGAARGGEFYPDYWLLTGAWRCRAGDCALGLPGKGEIVQPIRLFAGQCYRSLVIVEGRGADVRGDWPAEGLQVGVTLGKVVQQEFVSRPPVRPEGGLFAFANSLEQSWRVEQDGLYNFGVSILASGGWAQQSEVLVTNAHLFAAPAMFCR